MTLLLICLSAAAGVLGTIAVAMGLHRWRNDRWWKEQEKKNKARRLAIGITNHEPN